MKIKEIKTENFKKCPDGEHRFGKVNVLIGDNGKGKTSLLNAIRYVLTGKLPEEAIRHGEDHVKVSAVIDDGQDTTIERTNYVSDTWKIDGVDVKEKDFISEVLKNREVYERTGKLLLVNKAHSNRYFAGKDQGTLWDFLQNGKVEGAKINGVKELEVEMEDGTALYQVKAKPSNVRIDGKTTTAKALNELLKNRTGGEPKGFELVTSSEVFAAMQMGDFGKYLMSMVPVSIDFDKLCDLAQLTAEERDVLSPLFPPAPKAVSPNDVASVYKLLISTRQSITKRMEELRAKAQFEGQLPCMKREEVDKKIQEVSAQIAAYNQLKQAWDVYNKRVAERQTSINTLKDWISEFNGIGPVNTPEEGELKGLLEKEAEIRTRISEHEKQAASLYQACVPIRKMLGNLDATSCPLCDKLVCKTDKTEAKKSLEDAIRANESAIETINKAVDADKKLLEQVSADQEKTREKVSLYDKKAALYKKIQDLKAAIPGNPEKPADLHDPAGLQNELQTLGEYKRLYLLYDECKKNLEDYKAVKAKYKLYSGLVKKAEPKKGLLTVTILDYLLAPFADHVNHFLKGIYGDTEVQFKMDDSGLQVLCKPHGRDSFLPVSVLSRGESMLATFALMDMVSSISNARMLVFDNLESLDKQSLENLLSMFLKDEMADQYDHIFLSMVGHGSIAEAIKKYPVSVIKF